MVTVNKKNNVSNNAVAAWEKKADADNVLLLEHMFRFVFRQHKTYEFNAIVDLSRLGQNISVLKS